MSEQKSFITQLGELIDEQRAAKKHNHTQNRSQQNHTFRITRWLPTPGNIIFTLLIVGLLIMTQGVWALPNLAAVPGASATTINYQGRLSDNGGTPLSGPYKLDFAIYDTPSDGNLIWGPESYSNVDVTNGLFSVGLGSQIAIPTTTWDGDRYLEIIVNDEALTPREQIRSVPIAGMALTVPDGAIGMGQIADGAVGTEQIAEEAVGTEKIAEGAVTSSKLHPTMERVDATLTELTEELQTVSETSINVETPSRVWLVATCDCYTDNGALIIGRIIVDGNPLFEKLIAGTYPTGSHNTSLRYTVSNNYVFELESGPHTIELQAMLADDSGGGRVYRNSGFSYMVVGQ